MCVSECVKGCVGVSIIVMRMFVCRVGEWRYYMVEVAGWYVKIRKTFLEVLFSRVFGEVNNCNSLTLFKFAFNDITYTVSNNYFHCYIKKQL